MSTFTVPILAIDAVTDHPNADRLSILRVRGYNAVAAKNEDGTHRFQAGEIIAYVPEAAVVPHVHLKDRGYWNHAKDVGFLAGAHGDRVKALTLRGVLSQGLVWKTIPFEGGVAVDAPTAGGGDGVRVVRPVQVGEDVADFFGVTKYEPPIPAGMDGDVVALYEAMFDYDIENLKTFPKLFGPDDVVTVTEKLHGSFCRISYLPQLEPRDDLFGDGRVVITSKGLGARGLVFLNTAHNREKNLYVRRMLPLVDRFVEMCQRYVEAGHKVHLMGEVYGPGVQDLHYGQPEQTFSAFDVFINGFLAETEKDYAFTAFGVDRVPVLFEGPFDADLIAEFTTGATTVQNPADGSTPKQIREGVVITLADDQTKREDGNGLGGVLRPILKSISPAYLTRKGGTELQ